MNMEVHVDRRIKDGENRVEIGLATFARSQYVIFDYDRRYIGFGGPHDMKPSPYQPQGGSGLAIFFLIVGLLLILAIGVFGV